MSKLTRPETHYARSGQINIAYQVFGSGKVDLIYIPGWVSNIDLMWECADLVDFFTKLSQNARVILFDKRGTGLSDRIVNFATLEDRMDDIRAVMNAAGSEKCILFGHSEGGSASVLFAATYPSLVLGLITFGIFAKRKYSDDYPWAPTEKERQSVYKMIENDWGGDEMQLESLAPSKANDQVFMNWLARYFRSGASPGAALFLTKMNTEIDIVDILGAIRVPSLILQRTGDIDVKLEEGRFVAAQIPNARFVQLEGKDHLFWVGDTSSVLKEINEFIVHAKPKPTAIDGLYTVLDMHFFREELEPLQNAVDRFAKHFEGKILKQSKGHFSVAFKGSVNAVNCVFNLANHLQSHRTRLAAFLYMKNGLTQIKENQNVTDIVLRASLSTRKTTNQIFVSSVVKKMLHGTGLEFEAHESVLNPVTGDIPVLYRLKNKRSQFSPPKSSSYEMLTTQSSFMEKVYETIHKHLENESFGVEKLSNELGISERQIQRKVKAFTNKSPGQLIILTRLNKAKELLAFNRYSIAEVAYQVGFSCPSYFSKLFKREFGENPSSVMLRLHSNTPTSRD